MSWRQAFSAFLRSGTAISMAGGLVATGCYVIYKDGTRYPRMMDTYARGNILPPMKENAFETVYFSRPDLEQTLSRVLRPTFCNGYFLVNGDYGTGKTRTLVELIRRQMETEGRLERGAPVYVMVHQGSCFPETLASAVNFRFDEHISFKFFVDFVMRIHSIPERDEGNRLTRVLDAIEESSFMYMQRTGRPAVIVIDGIDHLHCSMPGALERLQEKAKLWADTNTVKMIFVNNSEEAESLLQKNASCWSRLATPIIVEDLTEDEAVNFLVSDTFMEHDLASSQSSDRIVVSAMPPDSVRWIVDLVGGRILHLIEFKRAWIAGIGLEEIAEEQKNREREDLLKVWGSSTARRLITTIQSAPDKAVPLSTMVKMTSFADVCALAKRHVIRYDRDPAKGLVVTFRSKLTSHVVDEIQHAFSSDDDVTKL